LCIFNVMRNQKGEIGMKKLMIVIGSPRKNGNSVYLAGLAAEAARSAEAVVEMVNLGSLVNLKPCVSCYSCLKSRDSGCVIRDDLNAILEKLRTQDALLLVGPVYWFSFSAQMKIFIDRAFFSMKDPAGHHLLHGKELGMIISYGDKDPFASGAVNVMRSFQDITGNMEAKLAGMIYGTAGTPEETALNIELVDGARALGKKMGSLS
jgi:multimeric flavodoxin WrbA